MEILAALATALVTPGFVLALVQAVTRTELTEDPRDWLANHLLHAAQDFSVSSQHFAALYLFSHGLIKLLLLIGLWRGRLVFYPVAIAVFGLFMAYQLYRYSFTHSLLLLLVTVVDGVVVWLTLAEYRQLRHGAATA
jgi:uncharacterized membrane protein